MTGAYAKKTKNKKVSDLLFILLWNTLHFKQCKASFSVFKKKNIVKTLYVKSQTNQLQAESQHMI